MSLLRKPSVAGFVAGALLVLLLTWLFNWLVRLVWPAPVFAITLTWQETLHFLSRTALPGGVLGALTFSAIAIWKSDNALKAKRMCLIGGSSMVLMLLARIVSDLWPLLHSQQYVLGVPGPPSVAWQTRMVFFDLLFNASLQWSILLALIGAWLPLQKPRTRLKVL